MAGLRGFGASGLRGFGASGLRGFGASDCSGARVLGCAAARVLGCAGAGESLRGVRGRRRRVGGGYKAPPRCRRGCTGVAGVGLLRAAVAAGSEVDAPADGAVEVAVVGAQFDGAVEEEVAAAPAQGDAQADAGFDTADAEFFRGDGAAVAGQ